jgi:hypothetical protein
MGKPASAAIALHASDATGQKTVTARNVDPEWSVGELMRGLLAQMQLPRNDGAGRPIAYHPRLDREGRHLHASERVGDALQNDDRLVLFPNIDAGCRR